MAINSTREIPNTWRRNFPWVSLLVWGILLLILYVLQELFFLVLTTFLLSFAVRRIVIALASRLRPGQESPGLERWLTLASFALIVMVVWVALALFGSRFIEQTHVLMLKAQQVHPTYILNNLLNRTVGAYLFHRTFGDASDLRYQQAFSNYQAQGRHGDGAYASFPQLQSDLELGFRLRHERAERQQLHDELLQGGTESESFDRWFLTQKAPMLFAQQRDAYLARWAAIYGDSTGGGPATDQKAQRLLLMPATSPYG